jgi:hypothetical protein
VRDAEERDRSVAPEARARARSEPIEVARPAAVPRRELAAQHERVEGPGERELRIGANAQLALLHDEQFPTDEL